MSDARRESRIVMAIEELESGRVDSMYAAAKDFETPYNTLRNQMNRITWKGNKRNNPMIFSLTEEDSIVRYILTVNAKDIQQNFPDVKTIV